MSAAPSTVVLAAVPVPRSERERLALAHESAAAGFAQHGQWQAAYDQLRIALEVLRADTPDPVRVPEPVRAPEQLRREVDQLRREYAEAREQSLRDSLTTTYNRRYLDERLAGATAAQTCVALADLDLFKQVNDGHGHLVGDRVLRIVVGLLSAGLPADAFCARYGGEEFALVLPGVDAAGAVAMCEAARRRVARYPWQELAPGLRVTVSVGVTGPGGGLPEADELLYAAKQAGRNAVAHRDVGDGTVRLAGPAGRRRILAHGTGRILAHRAG